MEAAEAEPAVSQAAGAVPPLVARLARCSSERSRSSSRASVLDALTVASLEAEAEARDTLLLQAAAAEEAAAAARERASVESALVQHAQRRGQQAAAMAAQLQESQRKLAILSARCEVEQSVRGEAQQALSTMQLRLDSAEAELEDERMRRSTLVAALQAVKARLLALPPSSPDSSLQLGGLLTAVASATSGSSEHRAAEQPQLPLAEHSSCGDDGDGSAATAVPSAAAAQPPVELAAALAAARAQARRLQEQLERAVCERNAVLDRLASLEQQLQQGDAVAELSDSGSGGGGVSLALQPGSPFSLGGSCVGEAPMPVVDVEALGR